MFVEIEKTEDPATLRFLPGRAVVSGPPIAFADVDEASARSPLAARLFGVAGVRGVALGADFIAVTRADDADWQLMKPAVLGVIIEHFLTGAPALLTGAPPSEAPEYAPEDAAAVAAIEETLAGRVRPALEAGGGAVALRRFADGIAELALTGALPGMPRFAIEARIANTLRHHVDAVREVRFVAPAAPETPALDRDDPEVAAVLDLVEARINPAVAAHGGRIALMGVKEHVAYIRLEGGCQGCGMADVTLKQGVEAAIRRAVPSIRAVLDVTDHAEGRNPYYQPGKGGVSPL